VPTAIRYFDMHQVTHAGSNYFHPASEKSVNVISEEKNVCRIPFLSKNEMKNPNV